MEQVTPIDPSQHTMGSALLPYLELKVHHLIVRRDWKKIVVLGEYDRSSIVARCEKADKPFNWHRPTAEIVGDHLLIKCFPGTDYVYHYALLISTYLLLAGRFWDQVFLELPDTHTCDRAFDDLSLDIAPNGVVVVGWGVTYLGGASGWQIGSHSAWKIVDTQTSSVSLLGFLPSIWGDIAGRVVTKLAQLGARHVVYIGKVGTLDPSIEPNSRLATGTQSLHCGEPIEWFDFFNGETRHNPMVVTGTHVTSPTTLLETRKWLHTHRAYTFVDPEIGPMGRAAAEMGISYGYLHIVSNNLACEHPENLANERLPQVKHRRRLLLDAAWRIIGRRLKSVY